MLAPFPQIGRIEVSPGLAAELLAAARRLPAYDNQDFYSSEVQAAVLAGVRAGNSDGFDGLVALIRERLNQRPYCVVVHGFQFDEGNRLLVAVNRAFGTLVARPYEKPRAQLVHYIQPATDLPSQRGGYETERLHTDTADWETPVDLISMVCVRADRAGGGRSRVLDVDAARDEVRERIGAEALERLEHEEVPWQVAAYRGGGLRWRTILSESRICWRRYTIDLALASSGVKLSAEMLAALDAFEDLIASTPRTVDFLMREGELLFSDNTRTVHARTPIVAGAASERLMIRCWIRTFPTEQ